MNKKLQFMRRCTTLLLAGFLMVAWGSEVNGQVTVAQDNAENYSNENYPAEGNLGFGFGTWTSASDNGGWFLGTATNNGATNSSILNTNGQAFGMWAEGFSDVGRNFPALAEGETVSFQVSFQWDNGNKGFDLYTGGVGTDQVFNFNINDTGYSWTDGGSNNVTGWDSNGDRQNGVVLGFEFTQTDSGLDYEIEMLAGDAGEAESNYFGTKTGSIAFSGNINALKYYVSGAGGGGGNFYFNNLQITNPGTVQITGSEGWRFLASPVATTYDAFINHMWTQGFFGSDYPGGEIPVPAISNVRKLTNQNLDVDGDQTSASYVSINDISDALAAGEGFAMYVYQFDNYTGGGEGTGSFPKTLTATGTESSTAVNPGVIQDQGMFSIIGNPFASPISWNAFAGSRTDIGATVRIYDYTVPGWLDYNGTSGDLTNGVISAFQGFVVESTSGSATVSIPRAAKTSTSGVGFKNQEEVSELNLVATHNSGLRSTFWMSFADDGSIGENSRDAVVLYPLDFRPFANMYLESDGRMLNIKNMTLEISERVDYPLHIDVWAINDDANPHYVPKDGSVELTWPTISNLPADWNITISDTHTGQVIDLRKDQSYSFELGNQQLSSNFIMPYELAVREAKLLTEKSGSRFIFTIEPMSTSAPIDGELPAQLALSQNYPNPFNPTTQISYDLPQSADVRLDVFNIQGQRVATLVNAAQNAGTHNVTFDARNLASGVYIYRLQAGATVLTKKMTLVK